MINEFSNFVEINFPGILCPWFPLENLPQKTRSFPGSLALFWRGVGRNSVRPEGGRMYSAPVLGKSLETAPPFIFLKW
jgi:hypothetical protein